MTGYIEVADLAEAASFRTRIKIAIVKAAVQVLAEAASATPEKTLKRHDLAIAVLSDPAGLAARFVWPIVANAAIAGAGLASPDGDLDFVVATVWDALAGVTIDDQS